MHKYEAMFIIKTDLAEDEKKALLGQINQAVVKNKGTITQESIWAEKRKLIFAIKKCPEGTYYLLNFSLDPLAITEIRNAYKLNENILRFFITRLE